MGNIAGRLGRLEGCIPDACDERRPGAHWEALLAEYGVTMPLPPGRMTLREALDAVPLADLLRARAALAGELDGAPEA